MQKTGRYSPISDLLGLDHEFRLEFGCKTDKKLLNRSSPWWRMRLDMKAHQVVIGGRCEIGRRELVLLMHR